MPLSNFNSFDEIPLGIPLSRYTAAITNAVATSPGLSGVWVIAELSDVRSSGGHCYMELIEKNDEGQTVAKMKANIWRNSYMLLRQKFYNATQKDIVTGLKVLVKGSATHHSLYGLSFNISDIDPSYTMGDMERLRKEIFMKLQKEGIVQLNKNKILSPAPQRIAVISAEGAAGYGDFMNQLHHNSEGFVFYTGLFSCSMQGDKVSESIRRALAYIESTAAIWDCIVIIRGGGATTDLNGFDDYELARAVALCGLPIIVGIGHERDKNVLDEIAHTSLKTPTAVAGFFIDRMREAFDRIVSATEKLKLFSSELFLGEERRLSSLVSVMPQYAFMRLKEQHTKILNISGKLPLLTSGRISNERFKINGIINNIGSISSTLKEKRQLKLNNIESFLINMANVRIQQNQQKIENFISLLKVLDPKNTLKRGYSITRVGDKTVKKIEDLKPGDILVTTLSNGDISSKMI